MEYHSNQVSSIDLIGNEPIMNQEAIGKLFFFFINEFKTNTKIYFHQLHSNLTQHVYNIIIQLDHINQFSHKLYDELLKSPDACLEYCEKFISNEFSLPKVQIQLISSGQITKIRAIGSSKSNKILKIQGIACFCIFCNHKT